MIWELVVESYNVYASLSFGLAALIFMILHKDGPLILFRAEPADGLTWPQPEVDPQTRPGGYIGPSNPKPPTAAQIPKLRIKGRSGPPPRCGCGDEGCHW